MAAFLCRGEADDLATEEMVVEEMEGRRPGWACWGTRCLPCPALWPPASPCSGSEVALPPAPPPQRRVGVPQRPAVLDVWHRLLGHHAVPQRHVQHGVNRKILRLVRPQVRHAALVHPLLLLLYLGQAEAVGDGAALDTHSLDTGRGSRKHWNVATSAIFMSNASFLLLAIAFTLQKSYTMWRFKYIDAASVGSLFIGRTMCLSKIIFF